MELLKRNDFILHDFTKTYFEQLKHLRVHAIQVFSQLKGVGDEEFLLRLLP